jgi:hypothetical protein
MYIGLLLHPFFTSHAERIHNVVEITDEHDFPLYWCMLDTVSHATDNTCGRGPDSASGSNQESAAATAKEPRRTEARLVLLVPITQAASATNQQCRNSYSTVISSAHYLRPSIAVAAALRSPHISCAFVTTRTHFAE